MPEVHAQVIRGIHVREGYHSNLIGWHPNFAGNRPPGNCARVSCWQCWACFCLCRCFFLESPLPSGSPSATGAPSVVVDSRQMLFGKHVGWCSDATPLGNTVRRLGVLEQRFDKEEAAVTVSLRLHFYQYSIWWKVSEVGEREGGRGKRRSWTSGTDCPELAPRN